MQEQHRAEKEYLITSFNAKIEQHRVEKEQFKRVKDSQLLSYLNDISKLRQKVMVLEQSGAQLEHHIEERQALEMADEPNEPNEIFQNYHRGSEAEERDDDQLLSNQSRSHVNREQLKQHQEGKHWKNVIHRQNEEYYLQRGLLLNGTDPMIGGVERMTQNTFARPIEVMNLSEEPFGEYIPYL